MEGGDTMYNNPYYPSAQNSMDRIDGQIRDLENMRNQLQRTMSQQPSINQTFQLAPSSQGGYRVANSAEEVNRELVFNDTLFVTKDFTTMWLKTVSGEVKRYALTEEIEKDEKDVMIESLQRQIDELKGRLDNEEYVNANNVRAIKDCEPTGVQDGPRDDAE